MEEGYESKFIKKVAVSRNSYLLWIPKDEAEYLGLDEGDFVRVALKKLKKTGRKKEGKRKKGK